jgi:hypothetical protein
MDSESGRCTPPAIKQAEQKVFVYGSFVVSV